MVLPSCAAVSERTPASGLELRSPVLCQYAHQRNHGETVDSVCRLCQLTVGRAYREADLFKLELRHVCQPIERRQATRIAYQVFNPLITVL